MKLIYSLCDKSGVWSEPYKQAGYKVVRIDLSNGDDVRLLQVPAASVHGVLAAPPCTHFAGSGARWWKDKGDAALIEGLSVVDACIRFIIAVNPVWWALENPVGRLNKYLGPPTMSFQPCDYGDPYTKKTNLWGKFNAPGKWNPVYPSEGSKMHRLPPSENRQELLSITPAGFARAFFEANP